MTGSRQKLSMRALTHRKFKLPLDQLRLADPEALPEIWCIVRRAADVTGVGLSEPDSPMQTRARTVISFTDTNKFDLDRSYSVLRKRIFPARDHSAHQALVFKFRHPDRRTRQGDPSPARGKFLTQSGSGSNSFYRRCTTTAASGEYSGMAAKSSSPCASGQRPDAGSPLQDLPSVATRDNFSLTAYARLNAGQ